MAKFLEETILIFDINKNVFTRIVTVNTVIVFAFMKDDESNR